MARGVDQIEVVDLAIAGRVLQRRSLRLDGYPTLLFQIHGVEHLRAHLTVLQSAAALNQTVGQRGFAVIDVRNDREVSDVLHQGGRLSA